MFTKRIIIGGLPRSGTTLFRYILDASPQIVAGPETGFFRRPFLEQKKRTGQVARRVNQVLEIGEERVTEIMAGHEQATACFDDLMAAYCRQAGVQKSVWAEKTPRNCLSYGWLAEERSDLYFISLIRDGRDVLTSIVAGRDEYHVSIDRYVETLEAVYSFEHERHLIVRYEDLVRQPLRLCRTVFEFLGLPEAPEALTAYREAAVTRDASKVNQPKVGQPISTEWIERWRRPEHAIRLSEMLSDQRVPTWLQRSGYDVEACEQANS